MDPSVTPNLTMGWTWHALQPLGLIAWLLLILTVPRTRASAALLLVAACAHAATWTPQIHMHKDRAYWEILSAFGVMAPDYAYGDGWASFMTWPLALARWPVDGVHVVAAVVSTLAVPHLYGALRRAFDERAAIVGALLFALAPLPLALAPTESPYVPLVAMEILAVHGLLRRDRVGDAMLVAGAGMVAHLRPLEGLIAVGLGAVAWVAGRRLAAVGVALFVLLRLALWWMFPAGMSGLQLEHLMPAAILAELAGPNARVVVLDPARTPLGLAPLALLGIVVAWRSSRPVAAGLLGLVLVSTLLYVNQPYLADRLRYELPAQPWWCALAGIGLVSLLDRKALGVVAVAVVTASWWPARQPYPPFAWQQEYTLLRQALHAVPPGATVAYDDTLDVQANERMWAKLYAGVNLVPVAAAPPDTRWRWVGLADHVRGARTPTGTPRLEAVLPAPVDDQWGCAPCDGAPIRVGLYEVLPADVPPEVP